MFLHFTALCAASVLLANPLMSILPRIHPQFLLNLLLQLARPVFCVWAILVEFFWLVLRRVWITYPSITYVVAIPTKLLQRTGWELRLRVLGLVDVLAVFSSFLTTWKMWSVLRIVRELRYIIWHVPLIASRIIDYITAPSFYHLLCSTKSEAMSIDKAALCSALEYIIEVALPTIV